MFHLPTAEQLRAAFRGRNVGAERNAWLYSYDATNAPRAAASPEPAE